MRPNSERQSAVVCSVTSCCEWTCFLIESSTWLGFTGFIRQSAIFEPTALSMMFSSSLLVTMMTGVVGRTSLIFGSVSSPVMPGIISSRMIRSQAPSAAMSMASQPLLQVSTSQPFPRRNSTWGLSSSTSSSTQSIFTIASFRFAKLVFFTPKRKKRGIIGQLRMSAANLRFVILSS